MTRVPKFLSLPLFLIVAQIAGADTVGAPTSEIDSIRQNKSINLSSANALACKKPGSRVVFRFSYVEDELIGSDRLRLGIKGLAYQIDADSYSTDENYDFAKDTYRFIDNRSSGFITRPAYQGSNKSLIATFGDYDQDVQMRKPWYQLRVLHARVEIEKQKGWFHSSSVVSKIVLRAQYNRLSAQNQIGDDVESEIIFTKGECVGNLGRLANYGF